MSKSIGIDLGTTNSVTAIKKVAMEVLKNSEGEEITPSCVFIRKRKKGLLSIGVSLKFIVGRNALEWIKQEPRNTITAIKRLMGRSANDAEIRKLIRENHLHYKIKSQSRGSHNSIAVQIEDQEFTPEEISAKILTKLRKDAEQALHDRVEYAVITVPAYFNDKQKHATRTAAALAGLKVKRLLPEPTAAAIAFGVDQRLSHDGKTILVFDFGGGTLDLSILSISGGQFIELGKGGDMWLGGEDIDRILSRYILEQTAEMQKIDDMDGFIDQQTDLRKNRFWGALKLAVKRAKHQLTTADKAYIEILGHLADSDDHLLDVDVEVTRMMFDRLIEPLVQRAVKLTGELIKDIHFTNDMIDYLLMVGGSSRIPAVQDALKAVFGADKVLVHERPMLAIAEGAAILSHRLADIYECPQCGKTVSQIMAFCPHCKLDLNTYTVEHGIVDIVHTTAHDYYIRLENDERHQLIERNTPLPCQVTETFTLVDQNQQLIHMKFFNVVNEEEESIGDLWLGIDDEYVDPLSALNHPPQLTISLTIDENNLIYVEAAIKGREDIRLSKTLSRGKVDEKLLLDLENTINEANRKKYSDYIITDLVHRSMSAINNINRMVHPQTEQIDERMYQLAKLKIEKAGIMAAEDYAAKPTLYFAESVLKNYDQVLPSHLRKTIKRQIAHLNQMDETGTLEENIQAVEDLNTTLCDRLGPISDLMEIQKAAEICATADPGQSSRFLQYINDIVLELINNRFDKATVLIEEILPEVYPLVRKEDSKTGKIYKDLTR